MGTFKVKSIINLDQTKVGDVIPESDFASITQSGNFVQLEYIEDENQKEPYKVEPGIWSIVKTAIGYKLTATTFIQDKLLPQLLQTKDITDKIDCFFKKIHLYKDFGYDVAKRVMLLYGPPGTGKSSIINLIANKYSSDSKTAVIIWPTDQLDPYEIKQFIKTFDYVGVEKMILICEDVGGIEMDQVRIKSDSSLLSLLDNQDKTFTIPTFGIATTNFPENLLGNLVNRPGRFDDKIEVGYPDGNSRKELLKFFSKEVVDETVLEEISLKKYQDFSPAHIKEVIIRSALYDMTLLASIKKIQSEIETYKKAFTKTAKLGIQDGYDPEFD